MSTNAKRIERIDTNEIGNRDASRESIVIAKKLSGSDVFNNNSPEDYIQRADIEDFGRGSLVLWNEETPYPINSYVSFDISGSEYIFRSLIEDNLGNVPSITNETYWKMIGIDLSTLKQPRNLSYSQTDLIDSGSGNYYLPLGAGDFAIIESKINSIQQPLLRDNTFTPNRLYGFANNDTQNIVLTVI